MTKTQMIKQTLRELKNPSATNREIADQCQKTFGFKPTAQAMTAAVGAEGVRRMKRFNAAQMIEVNRTSKLLFDSNFDDYSACLEACRYVSKD